MYLLVFRLRRTGTNPSCSSRSASPYLSFFRACAFVVLHGLDLTGRESIFEKGGKWNHEHGTYRINYELIMRID